MLMLLSGPWRRLPVRRTQVPVGVDEEHEAHHVGNVQRSWQLAVMFNKNIFCQDDGIAYNPDRETLRELSKRLTFSVRRPWSRQL